MNERYSLQRLRTLRKLTHAVAGALRSELKEHLGTVSLLLRPRTVLGDFIDSSVKGEVKGSDVDFRDLRSKYEGVAGARPYGLPMELNPPIEIVSSSPVLTPLEYPYSQRRGASRRPSRWRSR